MRATMITPIRTVWLQALRQKRMRTTQKAVVVGARGFELRTPGSQNQCSTRLSYTPIKTAGALSARFASRRQVVLRRTLETAPAHSESDVKFRSSGFEMRVYDTVTNPQTERFCPSTGDLQNT